MCVQGIEVEAIWKPLNFSIHCSDVLQATSSQGRKSFQGELEQLMLMRCLLLGVPVFSTENMRVR